MCKAMDVAGYICNYPDLYVDNLKLQKLVFYSQAISLVIRNEPLFKEDIEAWDYGPVVPGLYRKFKKYEAQLPKTNDNIKCSNEDIEMIDLALSHYGQMNGCQLINLTHSEKPWQEAYAKGRNTIIEQNKIKEFYSTIYHYE